LSEGEGGREEQEEAEEGFESTRHDAPLEGGEGWRMRRGLYGNR
jgi:hypothetical protein